MNIPTQLRVTEIFYSLQGEAASVGLPTVFVRLTGCPLRCQYCDTAYAFSGGEMWSIDQIINEVSSYNPKYVTVTGGEPLAQQGALQLLKFLCDEEYCVSLETSGAIDISSVDKRVIKVMDLKTPSSLEESKNNYMNIDYLMPHDQVKFVICDRQDYEWSKNIVIQYKLLDKVSELLFSPSHDELAPALLAQWILQDNLSVRMQLQIHKYIWG